MGALKTGGQGSIYKARRTGEIISAVKLLPTPIYSESLNDKNFTDFQNEVQKLKRVNEKPNPNIVKILNSGVTETGSFPFIEMEFIEGPDLEELLKPPHDPVFTIKETIKVADQLINALAHCHRCDVRHGDIKSNNVKYNIHTGNYILLDFGLAIMSDEQRRTSLRQAGAIEFMAPEQNDGKMLFQTDVYSFGIIIYELLAGRVPFPLENKSETARNMIRLAHMATPPPDLMKLREEHIPNDWPDEKRQHEMNVPHWLVDMIYKCLEKDPNKRFTNGQELQEYIWLNNTLSNKKNERIEDQLLALREENKKLQEEKEQLQEVVAKYQEVANNIQQRNEAIPQKNNASWVSMIAPLLILGLLGLSFFLYQRYTQQQPETLITKTDSTVPQPEKPRQIIGQYKVKASRAYFHNEPDVNTKRTAYLIPSSDVIAGLDEKNGFIYTEFTNNLGKTSKGWVRNQDLISLDEWAKGNQAAKKEPRLTKEDINLQLKDARQLLQKNEIREALYIYNYLAEQEIPEAMYQYGNLALKGLNEDIDCDEGFKLVSKASDKGYTPAKRTFGLLYVFAENEEILRINNYNHCKYQKDFIKGSALLAEAVLRGDSTAKLLMDQIEQKQNEQEPQNN